MKHSQTRHNGILVKVLGLMAAALLALSSSAQELVDLTSPTGGTITYCSSLSPYLGDKVFDNGLQTDTNSRWLAYATKLPNAWVQYQFTSGATIVNAYRVWGLTGSNYATRDPKDFKFEGSNNGTDWVLLDSRTGQTSWSDHQARDFEFVNTVAYSYYRFTITANNGEAQYTGVNELEFFYNPTEFPPAIENFTATNVVLDSGWMNGSLTSTGTAATAVMVYWGPSDGGTTAAAWAHTNIWPAPRQTGGFTYQAMGLATNETCYYRFAATNAVGTSWAGETTAFITGEVGIEWMSNGDEETRAPGAFRVFRAAATSQAALVVEYEQTGGTAVSGVDFAALSGNVVIPAGETSAVISVTPLGNYANPNDTTVTLSILPQGYLVGSPDTATLTIGNHEIPSDMNVWIASEAGNASVAANWSQGVPQADDDILLGPFSTAAMTWDAGVNGLPSTVKSWTQTAGYTGTVTFPIQYPSVAGATFTNFTVTGNAVVDGGSWTHPGNYASSGATTALSQKTYRLHGTVGGSFALGAAATLNATGRGFGYSGSFGQPAPSHGGLVRGGATTTYGSVYQPEDLGKGGLSQSDQKSKPSALGGGAIRLVVSGTATIDGTVSANGTADQNINRVGGSGGSIWITAAQVAGTGSMSAGGAVAGTDWTIGVGSGGRIAIETASPLSFSTDSLFVDGESYSATQSKTSGCGTIFLMDDTQTHGTLLIKQSATCHLSGRAYSGSHRTNVTPVNPGETWTFDKIITSGFGRLCVPEGATLVLPNGLSSVTSADTSLRDGLVYAGGTLGLGEGVTQTLAAGVNFQPASSFTLDGNLVLSDSSGLGVFTSVFGTYAEVNPACLLTVNGDLSVPASARVSVASAFYENITSADALRGAHGGRSLYNTATNLTYGSILNPVAAGTSRALGFFGAGVIDLVVSGQLLLDGPMSAIGMQPRGSDSTWDSSPAGSGGSISVRAGTLAGNGTISAEGGCSRYNYAGGAGGGRISIRLTSPGATFETFGTDKIGAKGISFAGADRNNKASSAGTVYLQVAAAAEAAGEVRIVNDDGVYNTCTTPYPGVGAGCDTPSALKRTSLFVGGLARVELTHGLYLANGELAAGSSIDLKGKTLTFRNLSLNGDAVPDGQYAYDHPAVAGFFADSVGGGSVVVLGAGTVVVVR